MLRHSRRLAVPQLRALAALLDFGACANAALDSKGYRPGEFRRVRHALAEAGLDSSVTEYLRRLEELERRRPSIAGDHWQFQRVALYREAVVRLSLGMVAAMAMGNHGIDDGIRATYCDHDLVVLFRIAMQCQIIDDVLDYREDLEAGLPSFLTACESLPQAVALTRQAASVYAGDCGPLPCGDALALRVALFIVSACARVAITLRVMCPGK
jgi:hypothetical protein